MKSRIIVVIPAYRCAPQIGRVLRGFTPQLLDRIDEVLVIDNQSSDDTVNQALNAIKEIANPKMRVVRNKENYNLGGTHKAAFLYAQSINADYVAILHGDNQATTSELADLLDAADRNSKLDAILGSRFMSDSTLIGYSKTRKWGNKALNILYSLVTWRRSYDLGSGLNLFKVQFLKDRAFLNFSDNLTFNIDMLLYLFKKRANIQFVPITWSETDQVSNAHNIEVGKRALKALIKWRLGLNDKHQHRLDYQFDPVGP